ncbi:MAG: hypothetical protein PHY31_08600 [Smithellaceae bacterium]|nr:hypothetical protein [Smithellaceae bacterium]
MRTTAATLPRYIGQPGATALQALPGRSRFEHCRRLMASTDWDERFLQQEAWINRICVAVVTMAGLYFTPVLIGSLLK